MLVREVPLSFDFTDEKRDSQRDQVCVICHSAGERQSGI